MIIYQLEPDQVYDRLFFKDGDDILPTMDAAHGIGRLSETRVIPLEENPEEVGRPSILTDCIDLLGGSLLLSERAIAVLHPMLDAAGYIVPTISPAGTRYGLFLCEREVDAIDVERTQQAWSGPLHLTLRYELRRALLDGLDVFRLTGRRARLFASDRFKQAVDDDPRLTGFVFRHVWSSETGGVQYPFVEFNTYEAVPGTLARQRKAKRDAMRARLARDGL